jgi:hypothetical protein
MIKKHPSNQNDDNYGNLDFEFLSESEARVDLSERFLDEFFCHEMSELWIPTTYDEFFFFVEFWPIPITYWSSFFILDDISEWLDERYYAYTIWCWVFSSTSEPDSTFDDMSLVKYDPIMSFPYYDIQRFEGFCDLFRSFSLYIDPTSIRDQLARVAWCISVGCPIEEPRTVKSLHRPLRLSESVQHIHRWIEIEYPIHSYGRVTTPDIGHTDLLSHSVLYRISCWEFDFPLCDRIVCSYHLDHTSIDIVTISLTIVRIFCCGDI